MKLITKKQALSFILLIFLFFTLSCASASSIDVNNNTDNMDDIISDVTITDESTSVNPAQKIPKEDILIDDDKLSATNDITVNSYDQFVNAFNNTNSSYDSYNITLNEGTYDYNRVIDVKNQSVKDFTINAYGVVFNAQNNTSFMRIAEGYTVRVYDLTIKNANDSVFNTNGTLILENVTFIDNRATRGAAIYATNATIDIDCCNFINSSVEEYGSAIYARNSTLTIDNSTFDSNTALTDYVGNGAATYLTRCNVSINYCNFTNNKANNTAGAIGLDRSNASIVRSDFSYNTAMYGSAIRTTNYGFVDIIFNTFINNTADYGTIYLNNGTTANVINNTFVNDSAINASAIYVKSNATINNNVYYMNNSTAVVIDSVGSVSRWSNTDYLRNISMDMNCTVYSTTVNVTTLTYSGSVLTYVGYVSFYVDDEFYEKVEIHDGYANSTITNLSEANHTICAVLDYCRYNPTNRTMNVSISKIQPVLELKDITAIINENLQLNATFKTPEGMALNSSKIAVKINGNTIGYTSAIDGIIEYDLFLSNNTYSCQNYTISMVSGQTSYLKEVRNTSVLTVIKNDVKIKLNPIKYVKVGSSTLISGSLYDSYLGGVSDSGVLIQINDENFTCTTDENGEFSLNYTTNIIGDNNLTVSYVGDGTQASLSKVFQVLKHETYIKIYSIPTVTLGKTATIVVELFDENRNALSQAPVSIIVNDEEYNITTDNNGAYKLKILTYHGGINNVSVVYAGNETNKERTVNTTFAVTHRTYISMIKIPDTTIGEKVTVTGWLFDENREMIINGTLNVFVNDDEFNLTTNESGIFRLRYVTKVAGVNNVSLFYVGNDTNGPKNTSQSFNVNAKESIKLIQIPDTTVGEKVTVTGWLYDASHNPIDNATLNVRVNDDEFNLTTNASGIFRLRYVTKVVGVNNVSISYQSDNSGLITAGCSFTTSSKDVIKAIQIPDTVVGEKVTVTGWLLDGLNNPIVDATLNVLVNDDEFNLTTNASGIYRLRYVTKTVGVNNVTITYQSDNGQVITSQSSFITSDKAVIKPIKIPDTTLGEKITVTGWLYDGLNNPIVNETLNVFVNNDEFNLTTNENGVYRLRYLTTTTGQNNVTVNYAGNNEYSSTSINDVFMVA